LLKILRKFAILYLRGDFVNKLLSFLMILILIISLSSCKNENIDTSVADTEKTSVVINLPNDDTVNGYRTKAPTRDGSFVSADKVTVGDSSSYQNSKIQYCGNINSKVFHKSTCSSVKKMKDDNKYFSSNRSELITLGYSPCKACNP